MLNCFSSNFQQSPTQLLGNHPSNSQGTSAGNTPRSPSLNLSIEFAKVTGTASYKEIWNKIHFVDKWEDGDVNQFLTGVLKPNQNCVDEVLQQTSSNHDIHHLITYFNHTEQICHLLLELEKGISHTCSLYTPVENLIDNLPADSDLLNETQCNRAYDTFLQFANVENPFSCLGSQNFNGMQHCLCDLKQQVDGRRHKPQPGPFTFIRKAGRFANALASVSAHALSALVCGSSFPPAPKLTKEDFVFIAMLDAAAEDSFTLHHRLQTIDRLACNVQKTVEADRSYVRVGIDRGRESHLMRTLLKHLAYGHPKICESLKDLETHICECFLAVNTARSFLLQEIQVHQRLIFVDAV